MGIAISCHDMIARINEQLAERLRTQQYAMWFKDTASMAYDEESATLTLIVPTRFAMEWIERNFLGLLRDIAAETAEQAVEVVVQVDPNRFNGTTAPWHKQPCSSPEVDPQPFSHEMRRKTTPQGRLQGSRPRIGGIQLRHELARFIVGQSNHMAYNAALQLAQCDGHHSGPLFIHGSCGLGKTHLLQGICRYVLENEPEARVLYTTGEQFTNAFITAVKTSKLETFRRRMRNLDLLAVDDVHFIASREKTQQEFLHSFDQIELGGHRVVLASDSHPKLIRQFSEALVSRCVRGMVVEIHQPDLQTRQRLITTIATRRGLTLNDAACDALAKHSMGSVREIEGMLTKLHALAMIDHERNNTRGAAKGTAGGNGHDVPALGYSLVDRLLQEEIASQPARPVRFETILHVVAERLGVSPADIMAKVRHQHPVLARSVTTYLTRELTTMSFPEIAAVMGRTNHSTIITAVNRIRKQLNEGATVRLPGRTSEVSLNDLLAELTHCIRKAANELRA